MAAVAGDLSRRVGDLLTAAGMSKDDPFREAMVTTVGAAEMAREAARGAVSMTPEAEQALVDRVSERIVRASSSGLLRTASALSWRTSLIAAGVLAAAVAAAGGGGWWWGYGTGQRSVQVTQGETAALFRDGPEAAHAWVALAQRNPILPALHRDCTGTNLRQVEGRAVCSITLWVDGVKVP
jgi:hypothetical protein